MLNLRNSQKTAFSLIELSIVLVIIGLLIAGVTGGASLIKSAELRGAMGEARGYNVAVNSFFVQYDELPGDYDVAVAGSEVGNRNGQIEYVNGATSAVAEGVVAWQQLDLSGVIDNSFVYDSDNTTVANTATYPAIATQIVPGEDIPTSKIKQGGWVFDYDLSSSDQNAVILTNSLDRTAAHVSLTRQNLVPVAVLTPSDTLSVDTKLDDGNANTGKVRGLLGASTPVEGTSGCYDTDDGIYVTLFSGKECAVAFSVDIT